MIPKNPVVWGIVPARGGSKGIPRKNIKMLCGKELLYYTAHSAKRSNTLQRIILSTDDTEIAIVGERLGLEVPFLRPVEFASDEAPMIDVIWYTVNRLIAENPESAPDIIMLLQPTCPLRTAERIQEAVHKLWASDTDSLLTVFEIPEHFSPYHMMKIENNELVFFLNEGKALTRRQDMAKAYCRCGEIYAVKTPVLLKEKTIYGRSSVPLVIPSDEVLTIDTMADWQLAEKKLSALNQAALS